MSRLPTAIVLALALAACDGGAKPVQTTAAVTLRPSSAATVTVLEPRSGAVTDGKVRVAVKLDGATIAPQTSRDLRPDKGHLHMYLDNELISMTSGLEMDLDVEAGDHVVKVEFVAADHASFDPPVFTQVAFSAREDP